LLFNVNAPEEEITSDKFLFQSIFGSLRRPSSTVEIGNDQPVAETLRQPLHEMGFFIGANLDRVAGLHRKGSVRCDRIVEHRAGEHRRRRRSESRQQIMRAPPAYPADDQQGDCGGDAGDLPVVLAPPLRHQANDAQACRYRLLG
jgi:hypothetical protein